MKLPEGCFPTMITPMKSDGAIDWDRLKSLTNWYIEAGCKGLFVNCLSSEMYHLSDDEQVEITKFVRDVADGRASVVSSGTAPPLGTTRTIEQHAAHIKRIYEVCDAVVVLVCQMAKQDEDDDVWKRNVEHLLSLTGDIPLGLYECPAPYHRLLSAELLLWAASTGAFYFHKDTCCTNKGLDAKLTELENLPDDSPFRFYNANVSTVCISMSYGAHGFSGISANFYPHLLVWLVENWQHPEAAHVQAMLSIFENVVADAYPTSAKAFQLMFEGFEGGTTKCRTQSITLSYEQELKLKNLHYAANRLSDELGIARPTPHP